MKSIGWYVFGIITGVAGTKLVQEHKDDIYEFLGISSPSETISNDFKDSFLNDNPKLNNKNGSNDLGRGDYEIDKTNVGGDPDRIGAEADRVVLSSIIQDQGYKSENDASFNDTPISPKTITKEVYLVVDNNRRFFQSTDVMFENREHAFAVLNKLKETCANKGWVNIRDFLIFSGVLGASDYDRSQYEYGWTTLNSVPIYLDNDRYFIALPTPHKGPSN